MESGELKNGNEHLLRPVYARPFQLSSYMSHRTILNHPHFTAQETEAERPNDLPWLYRTTKIGGGGGVTHEARE